MPINGPLYLPIGIHIMKSEGLMPDKKILGQLKMRQDYILNDDVQHCVELLRSEFRAKIEHIDSLPERSLQLLCMFSLIDCLAQEWSAYTYSKKSSDIFCDFVLSHQKRYDYLDMIEPVTLFYHTEEKIIDAISLDSLGPLGMRPVKDILSLSKSDEIIQHLKKTVGEKYANTKAKEHRLITLIYRMRSKIAHEITGLGVEQFSYKDFKIAEPYYNDVSRLYDDENNIVSDDIYELVIPNCFIRDILIDCIDGYLTECITQSRLPFENNHISRRHLLSWYDK